MTPSPETLTMTSRQEPEPVGDGGEKKTED